jgi:hypothetical protein
MMRGDKREGRFSIDFERASSVSGVTKELVHTVGTSIDWYIYDKTNSVIDPIYDVGADSGSAGRLWKPKITIPVVQANLDQGTTIQDQRGFYNTDTLNVLFNMDVIENAVSLYGTVAANIRKLSTITNDPDLYLRDRIVFRNNVFSPIRVGLDGLVTDKYTLVNLQCVQVNAEEMVNDSQFQSYANYNPYNL